MQILRQSGQAKVPLTILLLLFLFAQGRSQGEGDLLAASMALAYDRGDTETAMAKFRQLSSSFPDEVWKAALVYENMVFAGDTGAVTPTKSIGLLDTLLVVYESAIANDSKMEFSWRLKKALFVLKNADNFAAQIESSLIACFRMDPFSCPSVLVDESFTHFISSYKDGEIDLEVLMNFWSNWEAAFSPRTVLGNDDQVDPEELRSQLREVIPTCSAINERYLLALLDNQLKGDSLKSLFSLLDILDCDNFKMRNRLEEAVIKQFPTAYWHRKVATTTGDLAAAMDHREKAIKLETNSKVKAADYVALARLQKLTLDFTGARSSLEMATKLLPSWGLPHLRMADLMVTGAPLCNFPDFERKAVYWAAIDHCETARNVDESAEQEASRRIFEYQSKMPSADEINFRGLKAGDTYPLRCWMEVSTTVKVF